MVFLFKKHSPFLTKGDKYVLSVLFVGCFFLFSHPDLWETANHSYLFLQSIAEGDFLNFYARVAAHENSFYYLNAANYNILVYLIFGLWELPVFLFCQLFSVPVSEAFLIYWAKIVSCGFFVGCGYFVYRIAQELGMNKQTAELAGWFFLFFPIAFFGPLIMGQYDTLCLFFTLWAVWRYLKDDVTQFSLLIGLGAACKFFPLLIFIPLLLLKEKRILPLLKQVLLSLWVLLPTGLLFWGRTGNSEAFTKIMADRTLAFSFSAGYGSVSIFLLVFAMVCFFCYFHHSADPAGQRYLALYVCMSVFCGLFCCILWHPQWLILAVPFMVLTTFLQKQKTGWVLLDLALCAGFFLVSFTVFPDQMSGNLANGGLFNHLFGMNTALIGDRRSIEYFLGLIPYLLQIAPVLFFGGMLGHILGKFPLWGESVTDRLANSEAVQPMHKNMLYALILFGFGCCWAIPSFFEWLNTFGIL